LKILTFPNRSRHLAIRFWWSLYHWIPLDETIRMV